jgi:membrane protein CcdC involved in cytochrome C biogenesis
VVYALASGQVMALAAPLMLFGIYRRVRRNVSRQKVVPWRLLLRGVFLTLALGLLTFGVGFDVQLSAAALAGVIVGFALALVGLRHTTFEVTHDDHYYTPNRILGLAISAIFISRIVYRMIVLYPALEVAQQGGQALSPAMFAAGSRSPLTLALFGLVVGYYASYCIGVWLTSRRLKTAPLTAS